jgi:DNA-binding FadR family transcriptional regulator
MRFSPVKKESISDVVTENIKESILSGNFKPGDKFFSEHELMDQFQVSRIVVRESLRKLEATGLLIIKHGSGMFVAESNAGAISDALTSALKMQKVNIDEITEARLSFEPAIARLAVERMTPEYLDALKANMEEARKLLANNSLAKNKNIDFHRIIAEATQNRVVRLSMTALLHAVRNLDPPTRGQKVRDKAALSFHRKILKAIEEKDSDKTEKLMYEHIIKVREKLEATVKQEM